MSGRHGGRSSDNAGVRDAVAERAGWAEQVKAWHRQASDAFGPLSTEREMPQAENPALPGLFGYDGLYRK